jgi:hypothetical protein
VRDAAHADHAVAGYVVLELGGTAQVADDLLPRGHPLGGARRHQAFELARRVTERQVRAHAGLHQRRADGLGDVVDRAQAEAQRLVLDRRQGHHENNRDTAKVRVGLDAATDLVAAEAGRHAVEEAEVQGSSA